MTTMAASSFVHSTTHLQQARDDGCAAQITRAMVIVWTHLGGGIMLPGSGTIQGHRCLRPFSNKTVLYTQQYIFSPRSSARFSNEQSKQRNGNIH